MAVTRITKLSGTVVLSAVDTIATIQIAVVPSNQPYYKLKVHQLMVTRSASGGTPATTFRPRIDIVAGTTSANTTAQRFRAALVTIATDPVYQVTNIAAFMTTDANGRIYLSVAPDNAGDTFFYEIWYELYS